MATRKATAERQKSANVISWPGTDFKLTAEYALRTAIDTQVFSALRDLEPFDGGRAVQAVYVALIRRLPNVAPDRKRISIDCGYSESSVKRAIKLLETCQLVEVKRTKGRSSVYHLADLRTSETASSCLAAIRRLSHGGAGKERQASRVTGGPTRRPSRVTSEPGGRVTTGPKAGSQVARKDPSKNQLKQQAAAANTKTDGDGALDRVLRRYGLSSARYLVKPGHPKAIPLLIQHQAAAAQLIEKAMIHVDWSGNAGVGARVAYLREHISDVLANLETEKREAERRQRNVCRRAEELAAKLCEQGSRDVHAISRECFGTLLNRGLRRLGEPRAVIEVLKQDERARRGIVIDELLREKCARQIDAMTPEEFCELCEQLFMRQPGLRRVYKQVSATSTGLRLRMIEFLRERWIEQRHCDNRQSRTGEETEKAVLLDETMAFQRANP